MNLAIQGILTISAIRIRDLKKPLTPKELQLAFQRGLAFPVGRVCNLITDVGLDDIAGLLGGGEGNPNVGGDAIGPTTFGTLRVTEMRLTEQASPTAPAAGDTALEGATAKSFDTTTPTLTVSYPGTGQVRYSGVVQNTELGGSIFTEEGLFNANGRLIARTTFTREHTGVVNTQFDHTITITRKP
jgi:hypothetical protein